MAFMLTLTERGETRGWIIPTGFHGNGRKEKRKGESEGGFSWGSLQDGARGRGEEERDGEREVRGSVSTEKNCYNGENFSSK